MSQIEDGQVSAIVTSPPYYEMRDYKIGKEQLGHEESEDVFVRPLVMLVQKSRSDKVK